MGFYGMFPNFVISFIICLSIFTYVSKCFMGLYLIFPYLFICLKILLDVSIFFICFMVGLSMFPYCFMFYGILLYFPLFVYMFYGILWYISLGLIGINN